jgi:putative copper resistance protein D
MEMGRSGGGLLAIFGHIGEFGVAVGVAAVLIALLYLKKVEQLKLSKSREWPRSRIISFLLGIVAMMTGLVWPIPGLTMTSFSAHAGQHILVMNIAPLLLAMGAPMTLLLQTSSRPFKRRILSVLHSRAFRYAHFPPLVWLLYYGSMYLFFLTPLFPQIMDPSAMYRMDIANSVFFVFGAVFWWPVVDLDPIPFWRLSPAARAAALLLGIPLNTFLGLSLTQFTSPIAPMYTMGTTRAGADFLWGSGELVSLLPLALVYVDWMRSDRRKGERVERDRGKPVRAESSLPTREDEFDLSSAWERAWRQRGGGIPLE